MTPRRKLLVVDVAALGWDLAGAAAILGGRFQKMDPVFPAVTCTAQASFRTGGPPSEHGLVGNGLYFRDLRKPMFWEQSASLVSGQRIWDAFRARGGTVGMMFWQQSLGEEVDLLLSPKPVHKHGGGMVQDVYSQPAELYAELSADIGRPFNLMHYWGPLASHKSSDWIVEAIVHVLRGSGGPDLLLGYLPHLDYDLQRHGPGSTQAETAKKLVLRQLEQLAGAAAECGYEVLFFGDYAIAPVERAAYPNRALYDAGLMKTRVVKGRHYADFFASRAFAVVDHEVAHVVVPDRSALGDVEACLRACPGVGEVLDEDGQAACGLNHPRSGELVLVAEPGAWLAYPWWRRPREAPDFATHVDIHNKPGYDPCELFFGWPPFSVSQNTSRLRGSHGRTGAGREVAWFSSMALDSQPNSLLELSTAVKNWLGRDVV